MNGSTTTTLTEPNTGFSSAGQVKKAGTIGLNLNDLNVALEELAKTVEAHEHRITPILTPPNPRPEKTDGEGPPTDLGRAITAFKYKVRSITEHLREIDSRIEL